MRIKIQNKFLLGIIIAMLSVFLVSLTILLEFRPSHSIEFQIQPLSLDLEIVFNIEVKAIESYIDSTKSSNYDKLLFTTKYFNHHFDSLLRLDTNHAASNELAKLFVLHQRLIRIVKMQYDSSSKDKNYDPRIIWRSNNTIIDSIHQCFHNYHELHRMPLSTALKQYQDQQANYPWAVSIILLVIIIIAWVLARPFAYSMTKPIRALREGTLKVGEGQYETVPVISNDEVADLTRAFNLMSEKLKQLDEMRMQMMSEISHEMRTPLQVIKAGCYSIVHAKDSLQLSQRQRDAVGMIHQASNRINNFVNSFLDIAKMEAGLMKFNFQQLDFIELITPLIQEAQLIAQTRQIILFSHADPIPSMMLDKERISQAFSNLLSNALKYTPDNGRITVTITNLSSENAESVSGKNSIKIEVQDTGVGIPEADIGKLFNKFYQAKNVPLVNEKGSGLGLALVKHVAEAHGGRVDVKSQVGVGSTFIMVLPINV